MRIKEEIAKIDYKETKDFFRKRAGKFLEENPYSVTMYQDNNKELVIERNKKEIEKLYPLLGVSANSRILDVACGIGRWADAIKEEIAEYCGLDFSGELVEIAKKRNKKENFDFFEGSANEIVDVLEKNGKGKYNIALMIGILVYLNDDDVEDSFRQMEQSCEKNTVICIREPIGIKDRLTLKEFYSDELQDNYNAIYRTREEILRFFNVFFKKGFCIKEEGFLFDDEGLNNRKETAQYYWILERK